MSETPRHPAFLLDGEVVEARDAMATTTLLEYLRGPLRRCGTKEGCAEGDCGACTVVVGEPRDGAMRYRAVNSCIRFVGTLDRKEVVTVESLKAPDGTLHPMQAAFKEHHGLQCGFCTPGMVMNAIDFAKANPHPSEQQIREAPRKVGAKRAPHRARCCGERLLPGTVGPGEPAHAQRGKRLAPQRGAQATPPPQARRSFSSSLTCWRSAFGSRPTRTAS